VIGVEALLRWRHPERSTLPPTLFIPLLEESELILTVGSWVLQEACRQAVEWRDAGNDLVMSVNVSPRQLESGTLTGEVSLALAASGLDSGHLVLEITESLLMRDPCVPSSA